MRRSLLVSLIIFVGILLALSPLAGRTALAATPNYNEVQSGNWGGYSVAFPNAQASDTIGVTGNWTVPSVSCTRNGKPFSGRVGVWVGLGGANSVNDLEQIGTASECVNGKVKYWAWYEFPPAPPVPITQNGNYPISPGDAMRADVTDQGYGYFVLRIFDNNPKWKQPDFVTIWINQNTSAIPQTGEWVVEDPGNGTFPKFYNVLFTNCYWAAAINQHNTLSTGNSITRYTIWTLWHNIAIKPIKATTIDIFPNGTDFATYWNHY